MGAVEIITYVRTMAEANSSATQRRVLLIIVGILFAIIVLAAFMSLRHGAIPVRADRAVRGPIMSNISTNGKIEPVQNFEAHAVAPTTVKHVLVKESDRVKAGQLLVQLDDADARAQAAKSLAQLKAAQADVNAIERGGTQEEVLTTQSQLAKAQAELSAALRNLDALQRLQKTGAASTGEVQEAQSRVARAQADVNLLKQKATRRFSSPEVERVQAQLSEADAAYRAALNVLENSNIRASRDGMVYALPVRPGMFVNPGDLIVQVADLSKVLVRAFVDEPDIGRLARGQKVDITWDAVPGRVWEGTITSVPTTVSLRGTRTVGEVTCQVDNQDLKLLPNVNVGVLVVTVKHDNALTVPREAVHQENGQRYVYQVVNGALQRRDVETSISNLTRIEVTKGLSDNAEVVLGTVNGQMLKPDMTVRVVSQ
jgi:HlyD family secretion protein